MILYKFKDNTLFLHYEKSNKPFLVQPHWPDGSNWASKEEAILWAKLFIESSEDRTTKYVPGSSPSQPKIIRSKTGELDILTGEYVSKAELQKRHEERLANGIDPETGEPFSDIKA